MTDPIPPHPAAGWPAAVLTDPEQRTAAARHACFEEGRHPAGLVPEGVLGSWQRCLRAGLRPEHRPVFQAVHRKKASYLEDRDHVLLKAARATFVELESALAHSRCKVMLTDRDGVLLRTTPSCPEDSAMLRAACRPGVDLGELLVGTNAPSLTARLGQACRIGAGEHFYESLRQVRCVAAPIRNRRGAVVAVLDLTIEDRPFGFDAGWLVTAYAGVIENQLRIAQTRQQVLLRLHPAPALLASPAAGLAAVDAQGRIAWINDVAGAMIGVQPAQAPRTPCETVLGLGLEPVLALTAVREPRPVLLPSGLTVWLRAEFRQFGDAVAGDTLDAEHQRPAGPDRLAATGLPSAAEPEPTLAQLNRRAIERTLALCGGNVSRAARLLGVSRGLLYRRLRDHDNGQL